MPEIPEMPNSDSYRKQLRMRIALFTGLVTMREEIDRDIAEMMGGMAPAQPLPLKRGRPRKTELIASQPAALLPASSSSSPDPVLRESSLRKSETMKARWAAFRAGHGPSPNSKNGQPKRKHSGGKRVESPKIGFGTNADFIYSFATSHNGTLDYQDARTAAAKSANHKNLASGIRLSVALAEMKRKGFLVHTGQKGTYRLTPEATLTRTREAREQQR